MMRLIRFLPVLWAVISLFLISDYVFAKGKASGAKLRHFGLGQPRTVQDLPSSKLRSRLESLPLKAKSKALSKLQDLEFPVEDINSIRVTYEGNVSYADMFIPSNAEAANDLAGEAAAENIDLTAAFMLHSRPGSNNVLYLDFDGQTIPPSAWSSRTLEALPFDPSGNDDPVTVANFTQDELNRIHEIWHRIAEDYAPFDIDVTTEKPAVFTNTTGHLLFTHDTDANGVAMPSQGAGGTAFVGVFGDDDYARHLPAFVYFTNLSSADHGLANYNADAASHEFGHNLGLAHDGLSGVTTYYQGHGEGMVSWAPIMGKLYYKNVTQWSKGEYPDATNHQDDIGVISNRLGHAADDHGDSASQASALVIESNGDILVSSPEVDPTNALTQNKGVIEDSADSDWFYLDVGGEGTLSLVATPAWHSFERTDKRGSNLDIELTIVNSSLDVLASSEPGDETDASVSLAVSAGRYYVLINGVGNNTLSDYSDYGSLGMYFIEGHIDAEVTQPDIDNKAPSPAVMTWQNPPAATSYSSITMTATEATDESGAVEYFFSCVVGGAGCADSGWQSSRTYDVDGLQADTYYAFKVKSKDIHGNESAFSATVGDTTLAPPANQTPTAVASFNPDPAIIEKGNAVTVNLIGSDSSDSDGFITNWLWQNSDGTVLGESSQIAVRLREGIHDIELIVTDDDGSTSSTSIQVIVTKGSADSDDNKGKKPPPKK